MPATTTDQRTLWPGYVNPNWWAGFPNPWTTWASAAPQGQDREGSIAVMNPASGPGAAVVSDWSFVTNQARGQGHRVIGYVDTNYGARPLPDVLTEVDRYYAWYTVDGIMFDRMSNNPTFAWYYQSLYALVKSKAPKVLVVGNPGATAVTDWQLKGARSSDLLINYEDTLTNYLAWTPPVWVSMYPAATFAHLVHGCTVADLPAAVAHSKTTRAGYRYVTDDVLPNPWDTLGHWPVQTSP